MTTGIAEAKLAIDGIKLALDLIKSLPAGKAAAELKSQLADVRAAMLDAQEHASSAYARELNLAQRIRELEAEVSAFKTWDAEQQRYELKDVGDGFFAYAVKESERGVEPMHHLCTTCFARGKKSIIQATGHWTHGQTHHCPVCKVPMGVSASE